nr:uncharacterized mitochondrial protein AtMg00810-like [Tanacetum cinerariifolium]
MSLPNKDPCLSFYITFAMLTQQDIYATGSENRHPMLNKENYVPWSSRLLRYAKSRPNGKLIDNFIINGPYVRRMIPEPGYPNREVPVNETFHVQMDDELTKKELKQIEADDQAIQTILIGLLEEIYAAVNKKKAKLFNEWERFTSIDGESIESYYHRFLKLMNDLKQNKHFPEKIASNLKFLNNLQPEWSRHVAIVRQIKDLHTADNTQLYDFLKYNQKENYMQQAMPNPKDITDPTTTINMALALMAKAFKINYSTQTNNNQRISSNPRNRQIAQPGNLNGYNDVQNVKNQVIQNAVQNPRIQNVRNQNGLIVDLRNANQNPNGNGNLVAARAEGNATGHNSNSIRCYNCRGKEEAGIQLQAEEFDLMAAAVDLDKIEEVNENCILMATLRQASTSSTQNDKAPIYDSDGSAEVHNYENCYDNEMFNMFTQEEQYTELLEPIPEPHQVPQNNNNVISEKMALGYQNPFYLKQAQQKQQSLYDGKVLLEKNDPPVVHDSEETLQLAQESRLKMKQLNKEIKPVNYTKINHLSGIFVSQTAKSREEFLDDTTPSVSKWPLFLKYLKTDTVSKPISIPNEEFLDDTTPSVARKFLNEVKSTIVTLQRVFKQRMTLDIHNWSSSAHQELHKIVKDETFPIVNQVDARVQNFEIQFLKEADKFVGDFKSLAKEDDESLAKHKALELEIECLLRAVVSQDIMCILQNNSVVDTSNLQTEIERTKERFENCIIKKENKYAKLWNDWYKKCEECKFNKISYDKAYKDMQQKIEGLQAQLGDLKGKSMYTSCISDTLNPLSQKLENENVELEFQDTIYENANLRVQLFNKVSEQKDITSGTSANTKFAKQPILRKPPKQCLNSVNHDVCLLNYVNGMTSHGKKQKENVSINEKQKKPQPKVKKTKKVGSIERLASPKPSKPIYFLRWSPTGRLFDLKGKIITFSESESQPDCSKGDNACTSNPMEPTIKWFPNSTFSLEDEAPEMIKTFLKKITILLQSPVIIIRTDNGSKFKNQVLKEFFDSVGISHQVSSIRTPQQNRVVEWKSQTLVEAARTMLIFYRAPLFLWAEAIATVCFTQNRSIIHRRFNKTPYELINGRKPDISFLHVFRALCYPKNDHEDIGKLGAKGDIGFFIGYSVDSYAYSVYNRRTKKIMKTMNVTIDELLAMAFKQRSSKPGLQSMTSGQISAGLDLTYAPSTITSQQLTEGELDLLFEAMYDDYIGGQLSAALRTVLAAQAYQVRQTPTTSTSIADIAPTPTNSSSQATNFPNSSHDVEGLNSQQQHTQQQGYQALIQPETVADNVPNAMFDANTFVNPIATPSTSVAETSSSQYVDPSNMDTEHYGIEECERAIRIFLAYAAHKPFTVFQMDVKTAFLHGTIWVKASTKGMVYVDDIIFGSTHPRYTQLFSDLTKIHFEMSMMEEMTFFLGLQVNQSPCGIFTNQSIYVLKILKKYGMESFDPIGTPMEIKDKLDLDQNGTPVDAKKYRSMIGALMYLTSSRPDIVHASCLCAWYQAKPTEKHLKEVKRIFCYPRGTVNTGIWYTKDFGFELTGFLDVDYAECKDTFKSTSSGAQFLGEKL